MRVFVRRVSPLFMPTSCKNRHLLFVFEYFFLSLSTLWQEDHRVFSIVNDPLELVINSEWSQRSFSKDYWCLLLRISIKLENNMYCFGFSRDKRSCCLYEISEILVFFSFVISCSSYNSFYFFTPFFIGQSTHFTFISSSFMVHFRRWSFIFLFV